MRVFSSILLIIFFCAVNSFESPARPILQNDSYSMEIPQVAAMAGSPAHLYILSKTDGLIVFRSRKDSLKWLYTVPKMRHPERSLSADARFAYLFGDSIHLTVVDPTKFVGDFPSIKLPSIPYGAVRWKKHLYIALGESGLGKLSLIALPSLHSNIQKIRPALFNNQSLIDIEASNDQLFVLSNRQKLFIFNKTKNGIHFIKKLSLAHHIRRIFEINGILAGTNNNGAIFIIRPNGSLQKIGRIGEPVQRIKGWKNWFIIMGKSHRLWISNKPGSLRLWKENGKAGNYFAISRGRLWLCQYNQIKRVKESALKNVVQSGIYNVKDLNPARVLKLQPIKDQVVPYPHALLVPIKLNTTLPVENIQFHLETSALHAKIRGQSLYWKPGYDNIDKQYQFKIIASTPDGKTSSTRFKVTVEPFNSPPRFIPLQTIMIPPGHLYRLTVGAEDPDGSNKHLIRYLGVNLPEGASINPKSGVFRWKPDKKQVGKHEFRIIAADQYGAASFEDVTILVVKRGETQ